MEHKSTTGSEGGPLLIDTVPGEPRGFDLGSAGAALVFLGGLAVLAYIVTALLSGPGLSGGWEGAWFRPGPQFDFIPVLGLMAVVAGLVLFVFRRRTGGGPEDGAGHPGSGARGPEEEE